MILQSLCALYDRLRDDRVYQIAPPGYSLQKITFKVVISPEGHLVDIQDARIPLEGSRRPRQELVLGSTKPSGSGLNPCFLWDNSGYMLGFEPEDDNPGRTVKAFEAFRRRHVEHQSEIRSWKFDAVCAFLRSWAPAKAKSFPALAEAAATGFGVFQIRGETAWVHEDPTIDEWWRKHRTDEEEADVRGICLVSGDEQPLARLHEKIKGVAGAQGAGAPIVGFNEDAFESYGKKQSFNAPVGRDAAFRYGIALNALLDGPQNRKHRMTLGDTTVVFWTERPTVTEDIFVRFAGEGLETIESDASQDEGVRQKLEAFLRALREGREKYADLDVDPDATPFFILGLSPNAGRVAVRFFHRGTVAELLENLRRHYRDIGHVPQPQAGKRRADPEFPPAWLLLRQSGREREDPPPLIAGPLLRSILTGAPYPDALYSAVLRRIGADRDVNYPRACVLKGYLNRNLRREVSMSLDPNRADPAYRLGRLFAALEKTQRDALGEKLNKTIRDSFYGSASATPASVFPRLLRTYQHHLANPKLEGGSRVNREKLVQEILDPLTAFPAHLGLADQGLFAIGYYHQTRDFYTKREDKEVD
jgi:CRISPR-associated protein Csd1